MGARGAVTGLTLLWVVAALSCKQEEQPPPAYPAYAPYPASPAQAPAGAAAPGGVPAPSPAAAALPPAFGFFCATDQDPQCPYGRCLGGRCGGCSSASDCKAGAQCVPSFVGQVCLPGAQASPAPTAPASPAPTPAAPPATPVPPTPPGPVTASTSDPFERARQLCLLRTNEFRARVGVSAVLRRSDAEACADAEARADGLSRTAHGAFGQCRERAQNECPGWRGEPETVVDRCLAMMFAEGPGSGPAHGHYMNLTDRKYSGVSCGFATAPNGELWVIQNFH